MNVGIVHRQAATVYNFVGHFRIPAWLHRHTRNDVSNWRNVAVSGILNSIEAPDLSLTYRRESYFSPLQRFYNFWNYMATLSANRLARSVGERESNQSFTGFGGQFEAKNEFRANLT